MTSRKTKVRTILKAKLLYSKHNTGDTVYFWDYFRVIITTY